MTRSRTPCPRRRCRDLHGLFAGNRGWCIGGSGCQGVRRWDLQRFGRPVLSVNSRLAMRDLRREMAGRKGVYCVGVDEIAEDIGLA